MKDFFRKKNNIKNVLLQIPSKNLVFARNLYCFLFLFVSVVATAQRRPSGSFPGGGGSESTTYPSSAPSGNESGNDFFQDEALDTVKVAYFFAEKPNVRYAFSDTLLGNDFQQFTPMRSRRAEYAYLSPTGSPHKAIVWQPRFRQGFDLGIHAFDLFLVDNQSIKYYKTNKPFSEAKWTIKGFTGIGNDANFDFNYGAEFKNNTFVSLTWHRPNQSLAPSYVFKNLAAQNTNFAVGVGQIKKKYSIFASFAQNSFAQNNNGGIISDTSMLKSGFQGNFTIPVQYRSSSILNYRTQTIQVRQSFQLNKNKDSLANSQRKYLVTHQLDVQSFSNKNTYNTIVAQRSDSVQLQGLLTDVRGVRIAMNGVKIENQFSIATQKPRSQNTPDALEAGVIHRFYTLTFEPKDSNINNLFAFGKWDFSLSKWLKINTYAHFGLLPANAAEYCAKGDLTLNLQKAGTLTASLQQQRYQPTFMQHQLYSLQQPVWNNDFKKVFSTTLEGTYSLPRYHFSLGAAYHLLNNYIYFGQNLSPIQTGKAVNILQLTLLKDIHLGKLHLENFVALQKSTNSVIQLPTLYGKHGVYLEGKILKKKVMLARLGVDVRYTSSYFADAYNPLLNQFYTQNTTEIPLYPAADVYFSCRVQKARFFVKMENLTSSFYKKAIFYTVPNYPMYGTYFRFGVYRRFTD